MAQGRMLKKRISQSHKFAALKSHNARLLYIMLIPHLDIKGRFEADPKIIKGAIVPLLNFSQQKIWEYEQDLHRVGLIKLYKVNSQWYLEAMKFSDFQILRENHEAKSECPEPTTDQLQKLESPIKVKLSKVKESKYTALFETFWKNFKGRWNRDADRHDKGSKHQAFQEWGKLSQDEQQKAFKAAPHSGGEFTQDGCRWLKYKRWEDFEPKPKPAKPEPIIAERPKPKLKPTIKLPNPLKKVPRAKLSQSEVNQRREAGKKSLGL